MFSGIRRGVCARHATVHGDALTAVRLHVLIPGIQFSVGTVVRGCQA